MNLRHNRISSYIKLIADEEKTLGLISLQEVDGTHAREIKDKLGNDWEIACFERGQAILYNKNHFKDNKKIEIEWNQEMKGKPIGEFVNNFSGVSLIHKATEKKVTTFSAHPSFDKEDQKFAENATRAGFQKFSQESDLIIISGDFNQFIAHKGAGLIDNANNLIPPTYRENNQKIYDSIDGCFVYSKSNNEITQYDGVTYIPTQYDDNNIPIKCEKLERDAESNLQQQAYEDRDYYPVMFSDCHLLPVVGAQGKSLSVQNLEKSLRLETNQTKEQLHIEVQATRYNKKKILIYSEKNIPGLERVGLKKNDKGAYELKFDYNKPENKNEVGLYIETNNGSKILSLASLTPSPSLALKIGSGLLLGLAALGGAALIVGALAVASVITAIAPPIGITMIATGAAALFSGVGFFSASISSMKSSMKKIREESSGKDLVEDSSLNKDLKI